MSEETKLRITQFKLIHRIVLMLIKGPLGCLVSVKKRLKYTLLNSYYKSKCFARPQKACMLFTLEIFTGSSLKTFAPLKKIGVLRKFTISRDRESRDGGTFCWDNI